MYLHVVPIYTFRYVVVLCSPRVWLVTPLISQLTQSVLGRVLKSAGNILGQGQWWNPEKNQEKRRSTRATRYICLSECV